MWIGFHKFTDFSTLILDSCESFFYLNEYMQQHQLVNYFSLKWLIDFFKVTHIVAQYVSICESYTQCNINLFALYTENGEMTSSYPKRPLLTTSSRAFVSRARQRRRIWKAEFLRPTSWRKRRERSNAATQPQLYNHPAQKIHLENPLIRITQILLLSRL